MSIILTTLPYGSFRRRQAKRALKACSFDFDRLGVDIPVYEWDFVAEGTPGRMGQFMGTSIRLNKNLGKFPFAQMLLEELGHAVDRFCLTDEMRAEVIAAYGVGEWRYPNDRAKYAYQLSENFAHQGFMLAYAPTYYKSNGWPYVTTPKIARRIKEIVG